MVNCFSTKVPRPFNGEKIVFLTHGAETAGEPHSKNEFGTLPHTIHKIKMD